MPYNLDCPVILVLILSVMPLRQEKNEHDQSLAAASFSCALQGFWKHAHVSSLQKKLFPLLSPGRKAKMNKKSHLFRGKKNSPLYFVMPFKAVHLFQQNNHLWHKSGMIQMQLLDQQEQCQLSCARKTVVDLLD